MMRIIKYLHKKISRLVTDWLMMDIEPRPQDTLYSYEQTCYHLRPGDVILVDGRTRVSQVIKIITQSRWSHSAIYIGRFSELTESQKQQVRKHYNGSEDEPLLIESMMGQGVIITPMNHYRHEEFRLCRPSGLNKKDSAAVIAFCIDHLGLKYDIRQILDLARFLFPWAILPKQWRTSLFVHNAGDPTKASCSRLLAEAFHSVRYPILPDIIVSHENQIDVVQRNTRLFTPSDFDNSPFFEIIKFPVFDLADISFYQRLKWRDDLTSNDYRGLVSNIFDEPKQT